MPPTTMMYRNILVALDGSPAGENALPLAASIALHAGAALTLVHVREGRDRSDGLDATYPASLRGDPRIPSGIDVRSELLEGPVADTLLSYAASSAVDLIVMTSSGRGGLTRALFGSVADAVIRRAGIPVLIARGDADAESGLRAPPFRRVLLPLDGSELSEQIVPHVVALTGTKDVHYVLLRVRPALLPDGTLEPGPILPLPVEQVEDGYLSSAAARIAAYGLLVSTRAVTHAWDADAVLRQAAEDDVDLVAMTTRGVGGADRMIFGSVADKVIRDVPCSALALRVVAPADQRG